MTPRSHLEIRGRVSGPDGAPVEGAIISSSTDKTATAADGSFVLPVRQGTYNLLAEKDGFAPAQIEGVQVEDRSLDGLQIRLGPGLTLTGRVLGVDPSTVTGGTVWLQVAGADLHEIEAPIDSMGRFRFPNLPPREWELAAQAGDRSASDRFTPPAGQTEVEHDLEFAPVSEVRGRVTGPEGEPIEGASLQLSGGGPRQEFHAQTSVDGSFTVAVPDGTYTLSASAEGYAGRDAERPIVVAGTPVEDVEIQLGTNVVLTGRLLGLERGDTLKAFQIDGPRSFHPGAWMVDQEARYRQTGLWPGDWTVFATFQLGNQERFASGTVHIPRGATEATLDLDFHIGDLELKVRSTTPEIFLHPDLQNLDGSSLPQSKAADDDSYLFSHLRAGTYRLCYQNGDKRKNQIVELKADRELVVDPAAP
jgi:hypothetical protein